jgi:hypothetical protein
MAAGAGCAGGSPAFDVIGKRKASPEIVAQISLPVRTIVIKDLSEF